MHELIGGGYQYKVYDRGDRVEKVPKSREEIRENALKYNPTLYFRRSRLRRRVDEAIAQRENSVEGLKDLIDGRIDILGNPEILDDGRIYQDRADPVNQVLSGMSAEEQRELVDEYIEVVKEGWRHGLAETSYNWTINYGIDGSGDLILLDLGELTFSKTEVEQHIENREWLKTTSFLLETPLGLKPYFYREVSGELTVDKLEHLWREKV